MWNIEEMTGYKPQTTFYEDFSIADVFGLNAIQDTYNRAFKEWRANYIYVTELCMVVNWKCWEHYEQGRMEMSKLYAELYYELDAWCLDNLKGKELDYFISTTD